MKHAVEEIGNRVDGFIVAFHENTQTGFIRISKYGRERSALFFFSDDIKSGFPRVGAEVRCTVREPGRQNHLKAVEIEILDEIGESQGETA